MEKDDIFLMAERYVRGTGRSVFLTGRAGTGKTTFLKYITENTGKRFVVLAPTGVAAINAGGSTIHSFFQLPLCPYLPDVKELVTEYQMPERYRSLRKERVKIIRTLDLLIIDEISMVRADLLDAVDMTLRRYRRNNRPFGGVQLLMIGDAQQLSPVVKEDERQFMAQVYKSPYFFHSKALQKLDYVTIELQKVHRQKDRDFLEILNAVRENRVTRNVLDSLNSRVHAYDDDDTIRLTTHNAQADSINQRKLEALPGEPVMFEAEVDGEFSENSYPAEYVISLKKGAQVMFIRNDADGNYYNGKIGRVEEITDKYVTVIDEDGTEIAAAPVEWENIQYSLNDESGEIMPEVVGRFRQLPLRIAWAVTIHKSQGLTFDKVMIDAGSAFAFGQVYVALSRCRSLEGISLDSPIHFSSIYSDMNVAEFNACRASATDVRNGLEKEERAYAFECMKETFSFDGISDSMGWLRRLWGEHLQNIYEPEYQQILRWMQKLEESRKVALAFHAQLSRIEALGEDNEGYLNERLTKAVGYFLPDCEEMRAFCQKLADLEIDNKETRRKVHEALNEALTDLDIMCASMSSVRERNFSPEEYARIRTGFLLKDRSIRPARRLKKVEREEGEKGVVNEELREKLQQWRAERFKADNVPAYTIMHQSTLMDIAALIPKTKDELLSIKGFGKAKYEKYGEDILKITSEYLLKNKVNG